MGAAEIVGGYSLPALETMEDWALFWAGQEIPVFPLHEVRWTDGVPSCTCTCTRRKCHGDTHGCGAECKNMGKHPRWNRDDLPHGVENATLDFAQIRRWWRRWPTANVGGAMGGRAQLVALDFDPKNKGDLSLADLIEAHGGGWLETLTHKTGSGGFHFFFQYPAGRVLQNSSGEVGPGVDTRGQGGYVVLPPSIHFSGNQYEMFKVVPVAPAPAWLLEVFETKDDAGPSKVVDFQAYKDRGAAFVPGRTFGVGERNDGLRDVACGRWVHGYAEDVTELYQQMLEVRDTRCEQVPGDPGMTNAELWDLCRRTSRKYARGELRRKGAGR